MTSTQTWFMQFWSKLQHDFYQSFIEKDRWLSLLKGLGITLEVTFVALIIGFILGVTVSIIRSSYDQQPVPPKGFSGFLFRLLNFICKIYLTVIRGTPTMVQLIIMYFVIFAHSQNSVLVAFLTFGINSGAYIAEIFRSGIMSIDKGQMEAGRSLGFNFAQTMSFIIVPQAFKNVLPALVNECITLLKETSIVTVVGLRDLTKAAINIQGATYQAYMPFFGIAAIYLAMVLILSWLLGKLERRLRKNDH